MPVTRDPGPQEAPQDPSEMLSKLFHTEAALAKFLGELESSPAPRGRLGPAGMDPPAVRSTTITSPVTGHQPTGGRIQGPEGLSSGELPQLPTFDHFLAQARKLRETVREELGVDQLSPEQWGEAVQEAIETFKASLDAAGLQGREGDDLLLRYLELWERVLAYNILDLASLQYVVAEYHVPGANDNIVYGYRTLTSPSALEIVRREIEALGYIYLQIPMEGVPAGTYVHETSAAGQSYLRYFEHNRNTLFRGTTHARARGNAPDDVP